MNSRHVKKHTKPYQCNKCARAFALHSDLDRHVRARHGVAVERHACSVDGCPFRATRKDNLRQHHQRLHRGIPLLQKLIVQKDHNSQDCLIDTESTDSASASILQTCKPEVAEHSPLWAYDLFFQAVFAGEFTVLQAQMDSGLDVNVRAGDGSSALHCASRAGRASIVEYLLQQGSDLEAINIKKRSPLHEALSGIDLETVRLLILKGATLDLSSTTIDRLGQSGSVDILKVCLYHLADKVKPTTLYKILLAASKYGQIRTVQAILSLFINDVSVLDDTMSRIRLAAWQKSSERPDLDSMQTGKKHTPLQIAAANGHLEIVQLLINHGYDINQAYIQRTPLWFAVFGGHLHVAEYLLNHVSLSKDSMELTRGYRGWTPLHQVAYDGRVRMIKFLLDRKFYDTYVFDYRGWTPLHAASSSGRLNVVILLLERNNSNNTHNYTDRVTPLQLAALGGHLEVVQALLDHSNFDEAPLIISDVPQQGHSESIPVLERLLKHPDFKHINITRPFSGYGDDMRGLLSAMIRKKQYDCVQLLLSQPNIDVNLICWSYHEYSTPLILAIELGQTDIVELLLQHKNIDINVHPKRWKKSSYE